MAYKENCTEKLYTLVMIRKDGNILLGLKKRGFGVGKWNGFGGKLHDGETITEAAERELEEECGLRCKGLNPVGILRFEFENEPLIMCVHVFTTSDFTGDLKETDEMAPKWFCETDIPYQEMWPDDKFWLPVLLKGECFEGYFLYRGEDTIVDYNLKSWNGGPTTWSVAAGKS
ncbi:oxidized purine nucleoside triphosphate hydrolase isoform X2 [Anabrus simplex]